MFSSEDKQVRAPRWKTAEAKGRARELLLLLVTAKMEVGRCGDGKLLFFVAAGMEVGRRDAGQLLLLVALRWRPACTAGTESVMSMDA